eukprot:209351_1
MISESEGKQKELEVRVVQLEELLNATKEESYYMVRLKSYAKNKARSQRRLKRKNQTDWNWKQDTHKAVHESGEKGEKPKAIEKEEPDRLELEAICLIIPHSVQLSSNKNQTVVGKKELAKLRKKADQFSQLLTKAKALKEKNKDSRDEMVKKK